MTEDTDTNTELEQRAPDLPQEDLGLSERQINALEKLDELGGAPRKTPEEAYSKDPQIRAYQLIYEDRLAGPNRGQVGRKRAPRAGEELAEHIRTKLPQKLKDVLDEALEDDDIRVRMQAFKESLKVEREESQLQLQEEQQDVENYDRETLIATLFELVGEAHTVTAIRGKLQEKEEAIEVEGTEISEAQVVGEEIKESPENDQGSGDSRIGSSADTPPDGGNVRVADGNGPEGFEGNGRTGPNPFTEAARRRATNR